MFIAVLERLDDFACVPNAHFKKEALGFLRQGFGYAAPRDEQALLGTELFHDALKLAKYADIKGCILRLHLDHEPRWVEAERSLAGDNIDTTIGTGRRDDNAIALSFENRSDQR